MNYTAKRKHDCDLYEGLKQMTVFLPQEKIGDRLLSLFGRKRAVRIPPEGLRGYVVAKVEVEPIWRALLRKRHAPPPAGWVFSSSFINEEAPDGH